MNTVEIVAVVNSADLSLVPLRNTGSSGYLGPGMPAEEGVEVEPHD